MCRRLPTCEGDIILSKAFIRSGMLAHCIILRKKQITDVIVTRTHFHDEYSVSCFIESGLIILAHGNPHVGRNSIN